MHKVRYGLFSHVLFAFQLRNFENLRIKLLTPGLTTRVNNKSLRANKESTVDKLSYSIYKAGIDPILSGTTIFWNFYLSLKNITFHKDELYDNVWLRISEKF